MANQSRTAAIASGISAGTALAAKYGGTPGKIAAGGVLAGAGIYYGSKAAFGQTPGEMISKRQWPSPLDVLQTGSSFAAEASLVASASAARDARKAVTVKEIKQTLAKAKIAGRSKIGRKADMLAALDKAGIKSVGKQTIGKAYGVANPVLLGASSLMTASSAYTASRKSGGSRLEAIAAGGLAASPTAAAVAAPSILGHFAPKAAAGLSRFALPLMALSASVAAAREGYKAYKEGKGAGAIAGHAALGAADAMSFGLATMAYEKMTGGTTKAPVLPSQPQIPPPNPSAVTTAAAGADKTAVRMAQAAGQMNDGGIEMGTKPGQAIQNPEELRAEDDPRAGPKERAASKALGDASYAQAGTRYQRALIKGEQAGDPLAAVLANANRANMAQRQQGPSLAARAGALVTPAEKYDAAEKAVGRKEAEAWDRSTNWAENDVWKTPKAARTVEQYGNAAGKRVNSAIVRSKSAPPGANGGVGRQGSLDAGQQKAFAEANTHFAASHMDNPAQPTPGTGPTGVGFGIPQVQAAAQAARGVKNKTDWAKG